MATSESARLNAQIEDIFRRDSTRVRATLIRLLSDFDVAEDALQEAFAAALAKWPQDGIPDNPTAWLISTGRFKGIDALRRSARLTALSDSPELIAESADDFDASSLPDDRLRLIFVCCHPSLSIEAQVALTLREVCGLETEEIARAFLTSTPTLAQRIVRAKARLRDLNVPYEVPEASELDARLEGILRVIYLLFNEGYYASSGEDLTREFLSEEAIRLGRLVVELLPHSESLGLLALMLFHESRRETRTDENGDIVLLTEQDRSRWNRNLIDEGEKMAIRALLAGRGSYALQSAISAVHATSPSSAETDWAQIVRHYDDLLTLHPSPVIELNRAVAIAERDGHEAGLAIVDRLLNEGKLDDYGLAHSARADFCRRLTRWDEALESYNNALELATQAPERRFLMKRIEEVQSVIDRI